MQIIGIIFFACLAFAIAILILYTCCFFKLNGGKDSGDLEMSNSNTIRRMHQIDYDKPVNGEVSKQISNGVLLLHKKNKYSGDPTVSKQSLNNGNRNRKIDDLDGVINEDYQNDADQNNGDHVNDNCTDVQGGCHLNHVSTSRHVHGSHPGNGSIYQSHGKSNHGFGGTHHSHIGQYDHGIGHFNEGFSSHFSSGHHTHHHSGDEVHHGYHDGDTGGDGDD